MPMYLKEVDVIPEVAKFQSALIVVCRFCPAASLAMRKEKPYIELFRRFLNTEPYEQLISNMQFRLEQEGLKANVFKGNLLPMPLNFIICFWTSGQRGKLLKQAPQYEAIVVMGCEAAYQNVCDILKSTDCKIFLGMESEGIFEAIPKFRLPFNISLELSNVMPVHYPDTDPEIEINS
ncbi:MAG: hypothetical protein KJO61_02440 [Deltaproteobacteria bacterium]|nr:hypothetical protein [Deltaproteobacteria bacterium]